MTGFGEIFCRGVAVDRCLLIVSEQWRRLENNGEVFEPGLCCGFERAFIFPSSEKAVELTSFFASGVLRGFSGLIDSGVALQRAGAEKSRVMSAEATLAGPLRALKSCCQELVVFTVRKRKEAPM
jgi:hypothetical protein